MAKTLDEKYSEKFAKSKDWYARGKNLFAGGVTHQSRFTSPFPTYYEWGPGPLQVRRRRERDHRLRDG